MAVISKGIKLSYKVTMATLLHLSSIMRKISSQLLVDFQAVVNGKLSFLTGLHTPSLVFLQLSLTVLATTLHLLTH